jgi:nitrogen fixation protein NifU and related proteins
MDNTLYREELMEVYKSSKNRGKMQKPSVEVVEKNPLCGDEVDLQLLIKDGKIEDAKFDGPACAVSVIASNYLLQNLIGKSLENAKKITKQELLDMIGINLTTSRVNCATLVLQGLQDAIKKYEQDK